MPLKNARFISFLGDCVFSLCILNFSADETQTPSPAKAFLLKYGLIQPLGSSRSTRPACCSPTSRLAISCLVQSELAYSLLWLRYIYVSYLCLVTHVQSQGSSALQTQSFWQEFAPNVDLWPQKLFLFRCFSTSNSAVCCWMCEFSCCCWIDDDAGVVLFLLLSLPSRTQTRVPIPLSSIIVDAPPFFGSSGMAVSPRWHSSYLINAEKCVTISRM